MPLGIAVAGANAHDVKLLRATLQSIPLPRPKSTGRRRQHLCLDKGYCGRPTETLARRFGYILHVPRKGEVQATASRRTTRPPLGSRRKSLLDEPRAASACALGKEGRQLLGLCPSAIRLHRLEASRGFGIGPKSSYQNHVGSQRLSWAQNWF